MATKKGKRGKKKIKRKILKKKKKTQSKCTPKVANKKLVSDGSGAVLSPVIESPVTSVFDAIPESLECAKSQAPADPVTWALEQWVLAGLEYHTDICTFVSTLASGYEELGQIASDLVQGRYVDVLRKGRATFFSESTSVSCLNLEEHLTARIQSILKDNSSPCSQTRCLMLGVACLNLFMRANWTGPSVQGLAVLQAMLGSDVGDTDLEALNTHSLQSLSCDGEYLIPSLSNPFLLCCARAILATSASQLVACRSLPWWSLRYAQAYESCMTANVPTLKSLVDTMLPQVLETFSNPQLINPQIKKTLGVRSLIECSASYLNYWHYNKAREMLDIAMRRHGLSCELTGVMGKRTRWQKFQMAQLVLKTSFKEEGQEEGEGREGAGMEREQELVQLARDFSLKYADLLPKEVELTSDVLLSKPDLGEDDSNSMLSTSDQALLLALARFVKVDNPSSAKLTDYEVLAYLRRLLDPACTSWALRFHALYLRSVSEGKDHHLDERALLQLEGLLASYDKAEGGSVGGKKDKEDERQAELVCAVRGNDLFSSGLPSLWHIRRGWADKLSRMGLHRSALEQYEKLKDYERLVCCYISLGRREGAEKLLRTRLAEPGGEEDPVLWYYLGQATQELAHFRTSWEVSKQRYGKPQAHLGFHFMEQKEWKTAIDHFSLALRINPLRPRCWFARGHCAREMGDHSLAAESFTRTVEIQPDYGEAWNNLAASHIKLKNKRAAFNAFEQAAHHRYDDWKIWENYLYSAMAVQEFQKAMSALENITRLKGQDTSYNEYVKEDHNLSGVIDEEIVMILCKVALQATEHSFLATRLESVFKNIVKRHNSNATVWGAWAELALARGGLDEAMAFREKQCNSFQKDLKWLERPARFQNFVQALEELVECHKRTPTPTGYYSAKVQIDQTLTKAKQSVAIRESEEAASGLASLAVLLDELSAKVKENTPDDRPTTSSSLSDWA